MSTIKTNERELAGKVAQWFNEHINRNNFPFTSASAEAGVKTSTTHFGDIIIWKDRETNDAYANIELKPPFITENLSTFKEKTLGYKVKFGFTWDFQNLHVYRVENGNVKLFDTLPTPILSSIGEWLRGDKQAEIKAWIRRICDDIEKLNETGKLVRFVPEKIYFVQLIREVVNAMIPDFEKFIRDKHRKGINKEAITSYVIKQGISYPNDDEFYSIIARQRVYGLVTKIIFYLTIRRFFKELPDLIDVEENDLNRVLDVAFAEAAKRDWQAVFVPDPIEELGIPDNAQAHLREFFKELKVYSFGELKEDVLAELFEDILDPGERHRLGQYFTREDLVDFVIAAIVKDENGIYADPTCGSGTFLIRLYDRLKYLSSNRKKHVDILNQIWGVDIAKFPAELSTINLFRQEVSNFENFPRVINKSVFDIRKGFSTEFPPPNAGMNYSSKIRIPIPEFLGFVGNFPYIRQELIEEKEKGYKIELTKLLAEEYFFTYPVLFETKNLKQKDLDELQNQTPEKQIKRIHLLIDAGKILLKLSGQADIYTYIFIHLTTLLAKNGSFAIITSNSWLDVAYGSVLKQFFLDHFDVRMVIASWTEPWFDDAAVNTVVTVLDKKQKEKTKAKVKFVKLKKPFAQLIPYPDLQIEGAKRWRCIDGLVNTIEGAEFNKHCRTITQTITELDTEEMRIRILDQSELKREVAEKGEMSKWGKYLRAPDVYFELLEKCQDKLVPLKQVADVRFGIKTGVNEFFYLEPLKVVDDKVTSYSNIVSEPSASYLTTGAVVHCRNARGWEGPIEAKYLKKVIKSPKESGSITVDSEKLKFFIFICNKSKSELKKSGDYHALKYIEWGEKQKTVKGISWKEVPSVKGRQNWFDLGVNIYPDFIVPCGIGDSYKVFDNSIEILNDKRLYEVYSREKSLLALMNSTLFGFFEEAEARVALGDGLLDLTVYEVEEIKILNPSLINTRIEKIFKNEIEKIAGRNIKAIFEEVNQKDRKALDTAVIEALGLEAKEYLPRIYDGLCEMVHERLELPKMRKKQRKEKEQFSYAEVKQSVVRDVIPNGVRQFPEAFYTGNVEYKKLRFEIYNTSGLPLKSSSFFSQVEVRDADGKLIFTANDNVKAKFAEILAKPSIYQLSIPESEKNCKQILDEYFIYKDHLLLSLEANAKMKTHNWYLAEKIAKEIMSEYGIT